MKFGSGDLRFATTRTDEGSMAALPSAVASFLEARGAEGVVVGFDARVTSPRLAESLAVSLQERGIDVFTSPVPHSSCLFYWNCLTLGVPGVMITASHNSGVWNGMKMVDSDLAPIPMNAMERYMTSPLPKTKRKGRIHIVDNLPSYRENALSLSGLSGRRGAKILIDFLHGVNGREIGTALSAFPSIHADFMHAIPDGNFPAGDPNPLIESSVAPFRARLVAGNYDLGFCYDGDGDRTALYLGDGTKMESYAVLPLIAGYLSREPRILLDAKTPLPLMEGNVGIAKTGHVNFKRMMRKGEGKWTAGAEGSGHFFYTLERDGRRVVAENSLLTTLLILRAYTEDGTKFARRIEETSAFRTLPEISKEFAEPEEAMREAREHFRALGAEFVERDSDGEALGSLIMKMPDCQIYQHASETEPGTVRWQITEWRRNAGKPAFEYVDHLT